MRYAVDIETECAVEGCGASSCDHALIPHLARITCVGVWAPDYKEVFRSLSDFRDYFLNVQGRAARLVGQNFKFDLKMLDHHGVKIPADQWEDDTLLMGNVCLDKVTQDYLDWYEKRRMQLKAAGEKHHRQAGAHSLKVMAPFFLGVPPFWEVKDKNDDGYVLRDCEYTYRLRDFFEARLREQGLWSFYRDKQLVWEKNLLEAELVGINLDLGKVKSGLAEADLAAAAAKEELDREWEPVYQSYLWKEKDELQKEYAEKTAAALAKLKSPTPEKIMKTSGKYKALFEKKAAKLPRKMNLDSPQQVKWILKDHFGLDITDIEGKESTGKPILQMLAAQGRKDISKFLEYKQHRKLVTSFFPTYLELQRNGVLHCNFNSGRADTGRSTSDHPNLQQVPSALHKLFVARPGYKLIDADESAIEARLIAYYTEDPILFHIVSSGEDFHGHNTKIYFPELACSPVQIKELYKDRRDFAKELGYALFYGAGAPRVKWVSQKHGYNWTDQQCKEKVENFRETYRTVFEFKKDLDKRAVTEPIKNMFGRMRRFDDPTEIYMKAFNGLIQGSAGDLLFDAANKLKLECARRGLDARSLLFVHDEIVTEARADQAEEIANIKKFAMTNYKLPTSLGNVPLAAEVKIGDCWEK